MRGRRGASSALETEALGPAITRRHAIEFAMALAAASCESARLAPLARPAPPSPSLHLDRLTDIVPAAGLVWLVEVRAAELWANSATRSVATTLLQPARLDAFSAGHGGVDLRQATEIVAAGFADSSLALLSLPVQKERLVTAFGSRPIAIDGRSDERGVTRVWAKRVDNQGEEELAVFADRAVGLERGSRCSALGVAALFAQGRLRRAMPALRAEPLASAASAVGDAPIRAFAPGPFGGAYAKGLGGLLGACTAVAVVVRPRGNSELVFDVALLGAWGRDAAAGAERLAAVFDTLSIDPLGRLMGIDHAVVGPLTWPQDGTLRLEVSLDARALARGLYAATSGAVDEVMAY